MKKFKIGNVKYLRKITEPQKMDISKVGYYNDSVNTVQLKNIFTIRIPKKSGKRKLTTFRIFDIKVLKLIRKIRSNKNTKFLEILSKNKIRYYEDLKDNHSSKISAIIIKELKK